MTATMILFYGGDLLEFANDESKSLGIVRHPRAGQIFQNIAEKKNADLRLRMIQENYVQLRPATTPAGNSAGFERTTGENQ